MTVGGVLVAAVLVAVMVVVMVMVVVAAAIVVVILAECTTTKKQPFEARPLHQVGGRVAVVVPACGNGIEAPPSPLLRVVVVGGALATSPAGKTAWLVGLVVLVVVVVVVVVMVVVMVVAVVACSSCSSTRTASRARSVAACTRTCLSTRQPASQWHTGEGGLQKRTTRMRRTRTWDEEDEGDEEQEEEAHSRPC
jgi:hypothetical protein